MSLNLSRTVRWVGPINNDNAEKAIASIVSLWKEDPQQPITLILNSGGGSITAGYAFCDFISGMSIKLNTIGIGQVDSMAIFIFLQGEERLIGPHTTMLFHKSTRNFKDAKLTDSEMEMNVKENRRIADWDAEMVVTRTNGKIDRAKHEDLELRDTQLDASEMIELGIAHGLFENKP